MKSFLMNLLKPNFLDRNDNVFVKLIERELESLMLNSSESIVSTEKNNLLISFTTYSKRIHDAYKIVESIGKQTIKAEKVILWLDRNEFTINSIPNSLKRQIDRGLEIKFCDNIKSYKKLVPALKEYDSYNVITVDDDIIYPCDMIESLFKEHLLHPNDIIGCRAHEVTYSGDGINVYRKWIHNVNSVNIEENTFITTGGGTLFPPKCIDSMFYEKNEFMNLAPHADDIWLFIVSKLSGTLLRKVEDQRSFDDRFYVIPNAQDISLYVLNLGYHGNDSALQKLTEFYNVKL